MNILKNERGIALVMVLVLSVIVLAITAGLIYTVTQGTRFSGVQRMYKTALDANIGGVEIFEHMIIRRDSTKITSFIDDLNSSLSLGAAFSPKMIDNSCTGTDKFGNTYTNILAKMLAPTVNFNGSANWSAGCNTSLSIDPDDDATYDFSFQLGTAPNIYDVYAKIANTVEGNAAFDLALRKTGVVKGKGGLVPHIGYLYALEVLAQPLINPRARAKTSILFEY